MTDAWLYLYIEKQTIYTYFSFLQTRQKQLKQNTFVGGTNKGDNKDTKKNKQNNKDKQKDKITERYIGNVKLPAGQSNKNVLPSHWGPKIRHKPRPQKGPQQSGRKQSGPIPEKRKNQFDQVMLHCQVNICCKHNKWIIT
jgi:hypothetical protein